MKFTKKSAVIFFVTLIMGYFSASLTKLPEFKGKSCPTYNTEPTKNRTNENLQTIAPVEQKKNEIKPKVFNVDGFWDDWRNQHNKYLLEIGEVSNGEDFKVRTGETWLGLFGKDKETYVASTKLRIKQKDDSWTVISTRGREKPLFLVKNLTNVKAGKVKTVFRGITLEESDEYGKVTTPMRKGFLRIFSLGENQYKLRVEEGLSEKGETIWILILENKEKIQILHYIQYSGEGDYVGNLYWVGDLDSDGKLDLFMDFWNYEKGSYSSGLFISSEAKKGKLVEQFEYFALAGC